MAPLAVSAAGEPPRRAVPPEDVVDLLYALEVAWVDAGANPTKMVGLNLIAADSGPLPRGPEVMSGNRPTARQTQPTDPPVLTALPALLL
jgi:hypothetical protein